MCGCHTSECAVVRRGCVGVTRADADARSDTRDSVVGDERGADDARTEGMGRCKGTQAGGTYRPLLAAQRTFSATSVESRATTHSGLALPAGADTFRLPSR